MPSTRVASFLASKRFRLLLALAATSTALAQVRISPAGEPPAALRNGRARLMGHFNPQQIIRLAIGLTHPHVAEEEQFISDLATPGSPDFRRFLTADEFTARFGPSATDEQAVVDWATSEGFTITQRFRNRLIVDVEAPVTTVERALRLTINSYAMGNYSYFSNEKEPVIPAHLLGIIHSIGGLNNFPQMQPASSNGVEPPGPVYRPGPVIGHGHAMRADANGSIRLQESSSRPPEGAPNFTSGFIDPQNIYSSYAYNYNGLQNLGLCCNPFHVSGGSPKESSIP